MLYMKIFAKAEYWVCGKSRRQRSGMPVQTRSRSDKNVAVLGSKGPRQVLTFLNGLNRHTAPLSAECGKTPR